ncbi:MAG TPA: hypothetical protein VF167_19390, partial [Longimicrobiaceae bacterium]
ADTNDALRRGCTTDHRHRPETAPLSTPLTCQAPHPVARVQYRPHRAHCGTAAGVWTPTGRVIHGQAGREAEPEPGTILAWCHRCKAASEYRRVG